MQSLIAARLPDVRLTAKQPVAQSVPGQLAICSFEFFVRHQDSAAFQ